MEGLQPVIVTEHLSTIINQNTSTTILQDFLHIEIRGFCIYTLKTILIRINTHAIDGGYPKPSPTVAEYVLDLIVGQSRRVVSAEILMVLMAIIAVQPTESTNP